ncbi:hypothetical protein nbrc107696_10430 [Gordonia spumicola]|uniref:Carrier domain-containing protein n=1 Tax=Gordonia spumicola TaxID=589161 RepID=A0A7I9V5R6_9ACTN|nr:AMP-binding protein [Gordonia spumicola]GEE00597.1 hypothetical protein nbrc107696_10430 [Gordonia spumicola]
MTGEGLLPLTAAQRGVAAALEIWPGSNGYRLAEHIDLTGDVDPHRWAAAVTEMVSRVPAQRCVLVRTSDGPRQRIEAADRVPVRVVDLSDADDPEAAADAAIAADLAVHVDPYAGVTTAHTVFVLEVGRVRWYHRAHHVALDGYGIALCATEAARAYRGEPGPVDPLGDYTALLAYDAAYTGTERSAADRDHWHRQLGSTVPAPIGSAHSHSGEHGAVQRAGRRAAEWPAVPAGGNSYTELAVAAVAVHASRRTRRRDVTLGLPVMNRLGSIAARVPGMVLNLAAVTVRVEDAITVDSLIAEVRRGLVHATRHGRYRHEDLRRELDRVGGGRTLFGPTVNVMPFDYDLRLPGVTVRADNLAAGPVEDIAFQVYLRDGTGQVFADVDPARHQPGAADEHAEAIISLVAAMAAQPNTPIGELMRHETIIARPVGEPPRSVHRRIADSACWRPNAVALTCGEVELTRAELHAQVGRRAADLLAYGVSDGWIVAIDTDLLRESPVDALVTVLAAGVVGAAYLALPDDQPDDALSTAAAAAPTVVASCEANGTEGIAIRRAPGALTHPRAVRGGYLTRTSGTSGAPKLIMVSASALDCFVVDAVAAYGWGDDDVVLQLAPLHADTSVEEIFVALAVGARLVLPSRAGPRAPADLFALVARHRVSILDVPTSLWHECVPLAEDRPLPPSLRQVVVGGEEVSTAMLRRWTGACAVRVFNSYGPSETTVVNAAGPIGPDSGAQLGRIFPHTGAVLRVDVTDSRQGDRADGTRVGELVIYGPVLSDGYLGFPAGSEIGAGGFERIEVDGRTERAYATGDLVAALDNGVIRFVARTDDLVKIGGERVRLRTVEDALAGLPGVRAAAVARTGPYALTGFVVGDPGPGWSNRRVRDELRRALPDAWVPGSLTRVAALPRTANAKIDRRSLARGTTTVGGSRLDMSVLGRIRECVGDVLGEQPADDEDLFARGVTSMQAVAIAGRLQGALGLRVRVDDVLDLASIAALTNRITSVFQAADRTSDRLISDLDGELRTFGLDAEPGDVGRYPRTRAALTGRTPSVLLTGATGFVGRQLIGRLLAAGVDLVVPVRAADDAHAIARLREAIGPSGAAVFDAALDAERVTVTARDAMDVAEIVPHLGTIVHGAARVSAVESYAMLRSDNVTLTVGLAKIAATRGARMVFLSTATASGVDGGLAHPDTMPTGYARTKCIAEHLLAATARRGLDVQVVRLPRTLPGVGAAPNPEDFLHRLARVAAACGAVPDSGLKELVVSADIVGDHVLRAANSTGPVGFDLVNLCGEQLPVTAMLAVGAGRAPTVSLAQWRTAVATAHVDESSKAAALLWCDLQLAPGAEEGESRDGREPRRTHADPVISRTVLVPTVSVVDAGRALAIDLLWRDRTAQRLREDVD